jgi:hypothetical protein
MTMNDRSVDERFRDREPALRRTYDALLEVARRFGAVTEEAKKTSIHLVARSAFAGVATRKREMILTIKSPADIQGSRIAKREQASANRGHLQVRLSDPSQVDHELAGWLAQSYAISS